MFPDFSVELDRRDELRAGRRVDDGAVSEQAIINAARAASRSSAHLLTFVASVSSRSGASGGKRNLKSKYQTAVAGPNGARLPRHGPPINLQQKLADIQKESEWFLGRSDEVRAKLTNEIAQIIEKQTSVQEIVLLRDCALALELIAAGDARVQFRHRRDVVLSRPSVNGP